jgi:hypothetical protein
MKTTQEPLVSMDTPPRLPSPIRVSGSSVIVPKTFEFPQVCLFTGATENLVKVRKQLAWHHPAVFLAILPGLLIYVILALILRKTATIEFYMSRQERTRRRWWHLANWGVFLMTFVSLIAAGGYEINWAIYLAPVFFVATFVIYLLKVRLLYAKKIDDSRATVGGISPMVFSQLVPGNA